MRTSIDIDDKLLVEVQRYALEHGTTLGAMVEAGLRSVMQEPPPKKEPYEFKACTVDGQGLQPGIKWGDWETIRDLIYPIRDEFKRDAERGGKE